MFFERLDLSLQLEISPLLFQLLIFKVCSFRFRLFPLLFFSTSILYYHRQFLLCVNVIEYTNVTKENLYNKMYTLNSVLFSVPITFSSIYPFLFKETPFLSNYVLNETLFYKLPITERKRWKNPHLFPLDRRLFLHALILWYSQFRRIMRICYSINCWIDCYIYVELFL